MSTLFWICILTFFWGRVSKTLKNQWKRCSHACFFHVFIYNSKQRVAEGGRGWYDWLAYPHGSNAPIVPTVRSLKSRLCHDFVLLCILKKEDDHTSVCYFHIIHLYKQTINQTKTLVSLLITFNNQEKVHLCTSNHLPFQPPLAATSSMPAQHLLVNGCWNNGGLHFRQRPW